LGQVEQFAISFPCIEDSAEQIGGQLPGGGTLADIPVVGYVPLFKGTQYSKSIMVTLPEPTASTAVLIKHALKGLKQLYRPGYDFQKAGVMLAEIMPASCRQRSLFDPLRSDKDLMNALDRINRKWGANTVRYAVSGFKKSWTFRRDHLSRAYTTRWDQLPVVKASLPGI